jgi:hypothetical protein
MKKNNDQILLPSLRIVSLGVKEEFQTPLLSCITKNSTKFILPPPICTCDIVSLPCLNTLGYRKKYDCVDCRCDCDHCRCDCDHCRCDCDFCSCVSKGGLSPESPQLKETCEAHGRTYFKLSRA